MAHIGDVNADFPVAVLEFLDRQRVVKVLGIGRVDGERRHVAHVTALGDLLGGDAGLQGLGGLGDVLGILVRQPELGQDGVNLGIVLASDTQHVNHLTDGRVGILGPVDDLRNHLVTRPASRQLVQRDEDVGRQELAVDGQLGKIFHYLQRAHKHLLLALEDFDDLGFGSLAMTSGADMHQHAVAVERMQRVTLLDSDGLTVVAGGIHAVLTVTATDEDTLGHHRAVHRLVAARAYLSQEAVNGQLVKNFDDEHPALGCVGPNGCRHLLVVERGLALLIKEVDYPVVVLTTFLLQRLQSTLFCHILSCILLIKNV